MSKPYRPMLADDMDWGKVKYPVIAQPKIDGVRTHNHQGYALGRSMKPHANRYITCELSIDRFAGLDGELACGGWTDADLCRKTTSATNTIDGQPEFTWWIFDYVPNDDYCAMPYHLRYEAMVAYVEALGDPRIKAVPMVICNNEEELRAKQTEWLEMGFEGLIIRYPERPHKKGRSTVREGGLLRDKGFIDSEILVTAIEEAEENLNEAVVNELGLTERSSHQDNKIGKGQIGAIWGRMLANVYHPITGELLFAKGLLVKIGPGEMPHDMREFYFKNPDEILRQIVTFKHFPMGVKDKPRFPTYKSHRSATDMDNFDD